MIQGVYLKLHILTRLTLSSLISQQLRLPTFDLVQRPRGAVSVFITNFDSDYTYTLRYRLVDTDEYIFTGMHFFFT